MEESKQHASESHRAVTKLRAARKHQKNPGDCESSGWSVQAARKDNDCGCQQEREVAYCCRVCCFSGGKLWRPGEIRYTRQHLDEILWEAMAAPEKTGGSHTEQV